MNEGRDPWWDTASDPWGEPQEPLYGEPQPTKPPRRFGAGVAAVLVVVGAIAGAAVTRAVWHPAGSGSPSATPGNGNGFRQVPLPTARSGRGSTSNGDSTAAAIARQVNPGVVDINTWIGFQSAQAAGTGMVLTSDGEVLTNNHVIAGADRISVTDIGNGRTYNASVVGYDVSHDVAVLRLSGASNLRTVTLGDSSHLRVGQSVVGIGNARGAGGTPSFAGGSITALEQSITASDEADGMSERLSGLIETDADIVSGDSGGPLVNDSGEVVGIDTAASAGFRFSTNRAFAIPVDDAMAVAHQIEAGRSSATVHIGPTALLGVGIDSTTGDRAVVVRVVAGGAADGAGVRVGDTITRLDGHDITSPQSLTGVMLIEKPGSNVEIRYTDSSGVEHVATARLGSGPPQ